jgi:hypothetical protein
LKDGSGEPSRESPFRFPREERDTDRFSKRVGRRKKNEISCVETSHPFFSDSFILLVSEENNYFS